MAAIKLLPIKVNQMESVFFSRVSYNNGQRLIKRMGLWAAARYLRNLGLSLDAAVEILAVKPRKA